MNSPDSDRSGPTVMNSAVHSSWRGSKEILRMLLIGIVAVVGTEPGEGGQLGCAATFGPEFAFDGRQVLIIGRDGFLGKVAYLWDMASGRELQRFQVSNSILAVAISPDGQNVLTGGGDVAWGVTKADNSARLWQGATGRILRRFEGHKEYVYHVEFSPDGKKIVTGSDDLTARVWETESGQLLFVLECLVSKSSPGAFSSDSRRIVGFEGNRVSVWDTTGGRRVCTIEPDGGFFKSARFSPDGALVLTASSSGCARTWDARTGQPVQVFAGHTSYVHEASFNADGKCVVTASSDCTARLWETTSGREIRRFQHQAPVTQVLLSADGKRLLTKWQNRAAAIPPPECSSLWDAESGREVKRFTEGVEGIVGFHPIDERFLIVRAGRPVALWDGATGKLIREYK
ncbi:MAG TPA: WD40 repeat domain-containing protein [Verrucomicrobiota bacterium]|nr:WD40 repeat domain-containing protein [Verrucomicrobiota bacterium]